MRGAEELCSLSIRKDRPVSSSPYLGWGHKDDDTVASVNKNVQILNFLVFTNVFPIYKSARGEG